MAFHSQAKTNDELDNHVEIKFNIQIHNFDYYVVEECGTERFYFLA